MTTKDELWLAGFAEYEPTYSGVYALLYDQELVYIGKTSNVPIRVYEHRRLNQIIFDEVMVKWCHVNYLDIYEEEAIAHFRPRYNSMRNVRRKICP
jgi:excinuclease UvrABC nuclease subunit